ncbi:hypothetical protein WA1_18270 [Scytonema hofmannii PCC 7110]|uniref:Uncharacterized protein n=1 Tax=Scytonema hofmannii PCC 7110 TaxID=128403 RepID=A0A139XBD8_9CYAN|nr:hypothetical protein WA1_18270 [Scytonema hofmannii PCC 7110]
MTQVERSGKILPKPILATFVPSAFCRPVLVNTVDRLFPIRESFALYHNFVFLHVANFLITQVLL